MTSSLNKFGLVSLVLAVSGGALFYFLREDVPKLYINEFMASNSSCCSDTFGKDHELDDWIEIYNGGSVPVDIGGMYFSQDRKNPLGYRIPKTYPVATTIPPGGFLLVWANGDPSRGIMN